MPDISVPQVWIIAGSPLLNFGINAAYKAWQIQPIKKSFSP